MINEAYIFGGTGFIGVHFAEAILSQGFVDKVVLVDIEGLEKRTNKLSTNFRELLGQGKVRFTEADVRSAINIKPSGKVKLIANFAAVHREPGHLPHEYYETNIKGAENVCVWAENVCCDHIFFTSSIAPYGLAEDLKTELSTPIPLSPYGGSKLVAEKIHIAWQNSDKAQRLLSIIRPGVVFGPGEGGNVSRLVKAVLSKYFVYIGNKETRKAGIYVKELCLASLWVLEKQKQSKDGVILFNMTMSPSPSIEEYVLAACAVGGVKPLVPRLPFIALLAASYVLNTLLGLFGVSHPFSPVRVRKLVKSNNISPKYLLDNGYTYKFDLKSAFSDWKEECPSDWLPMKENNS